MQDKSEFSRREEEILKFWQENKIFEKSVKQAKGRPFFSFYDGPPFLSGKPHHGHILATTIKDTVVRYKTMKGFNVPRRVGWDCHGLPVENLIEKELNIKAKKDIEEKIGIEKFNKACKDSVFASKNIFEKTLARVGRWSDYSDAYMTLDNSYIESVWWVFKQLWERNLVYKDYRVTPYCPRCGTPLSNFEVNQGYKDVSDPSIFVKFKIKNKDNEYFLVWTTTPWTLTSNAALAINPDIDYVKIFYDNESLILAKKGLSVIGGDYKIKEEIKGKDLLGIEYEPLYEFIKSEKKAYFVVAGDFVSTEDGTGIVHIAPAFGADDMEAGKKNDLPVILTVDEEGKFKNEVKNWAGVFVKNADKEIIKDLESRNILFKSEKITHTYPFCWRCDSPLLYYPLETWYIAVEKIKEELIQNNKKINWIPSHIKEGRFGKWLEGARDWAFSRNRYWGAPVPIWQCDQCKEIKVAGSLEEIRNELDGVNKIFLVRHGDSENNKKQILNSLPEKEKFHLTESGIGQINYLADKIKNEKIDAIFSSPLLRTKETAEIISKKLGIEIIFDERIRELDLGEMNGRSGDDLAAIHPTRQSRAKKTKMGIESGECLRTRLENFLDEINKNYKNKNIVIVSHGDPIQMFFGITKGMEIEEIYKDDWYPKRGSLTITYSRPIDLHRPFIDEVVLSCGKCQGKMKRVPEVFDCWFESGAMPYAQYHYPFENKKLVEETFPADFIAEGLDQTRGWFYTLHVLAAALFNNQAFKNVVANGLILDSQGRKLSKKLRNYTEPEEIMEKFGADALRFYLLSSTAIGEDYLFDDKGVQESMRKITANLYNSVNFLKTYSSLGKNGDSKNSSNILDKWILTRLQKAINDVTENMDQYDLTRASRIFIDLLDDLSNWHIRRSRSRFQHNEDKKDYESAVSVLRYVLIEVSKLIAPFMPFVSEKVYQELKGEKESVHLEEWPEVGLVDTDLLTAMSFVRSFASMALMQRAEHNIKVRQPLQRLSIKHTGKEPLYWNKIKNILADEVNVKEVMLDVTMTQDDPPIKLDVNVTPELKDEGNLRGLIRGIQDLRKKKGFVPSDRIKEIIFTDKKGKNLIELHMKDIKKGTGAVSIEFSPNIGEEIKIDELKFKIEIKK